MSRRSEYRSAWWCVSIGVLLSLVGCGDSSGQQLLEGTVTLDGVPLVNGHITFLPQRGTKGSTAGSKITEGDFSIPSKKSVFAGTFRVEITALGKTGKKVMDPMLGREVAQVKQLIPARYNHNSELTVEVTESGPNRFEFNLSNTL